MNITDWKTKLTGFGCDVASANMAEGGLRGPIEKRVVTLDLHVLVLSPSP